MPDSTRDRDRIRTHLANERTFLAWVRTGITIMALGLGAAQVLESDEVAGVPLNRLIAGLLITFGAYFVVFGRARYRRTGIAIRTGVFYAHRRGLDVIVIGSLAVAIAALIFVQRTT